MTQAFLSGPRAEGQPGEWRLDKPEFIIGREPPADLVIALPLVSRQHARIVQTASGYTIVDLGSRNGTFVNGKPVGGEPLRLRAGDEIVLGGAATFHFHDPAETAEGARIGRLKGVWIDQGTHEVWVDGKQVAPPLSAAQFALLSRLDLLAGQVLSRDQIIATVWPSVDPGGVSEEAIDGLIKRVRARLREAHPEHEYIQVVRGQGVRLVQPSDG